MNQLDDFLRARYAEDEATAVSARRNGKATRLAEGKAKRRIITVHTTWGEHMCPSLDASNDGLWSVADQDVMRPCPTLRLLALPYADHPDYREEWKP